MSRKEKSQYTKFFMNIYRHKRYLVFQVRGETKNCEIPEMIAQEVIELKSQINKIIGESYNY